MEVASFTTREAELMKKETEVASRDTALDARAQASADREESAHREAVATTAAKDRVVPRWWRRTRPLR